MDCPSCIMYLLLRSDAVARRTSTPMSCPRPVRSRQMSDTASPTAARLAAAVSPIRNGVGSIGSALPLNSTSFARGSPQPATAVSVDSVSLNTFALLPDLIPVPNSATDLFLQPNLVNSCQFAAFEHAHCLLGASSRAFANSPLPRTSPQSRRPLAPIPCCVFLTTSR